MGLGQFKLGHHLPCLIGPELQASEASSSEEEEYFPGNFYGSNPEHLWDDPYWTLGPLFEQTRLRTTRQGYLPNFKQLSLAVLEKKILSLFY